MNLSGGLLGSPTARSCDYCFLSEFVLCWGNKYLMPSPFLLLNSHIFQSLVTVIHPPVWADLMNALLFHQRISWVMTMACFPHHWTISTWHNGWHLASKWLQAKRAFLTEANVSDEKGGTVEAPMMATASQKCFANLCPDRKTGSQSQQTRFGLLNHRCH